MKYFFLVITIFCSLTAHPQGRVWHVKPTANNFAPTKGDGKSLKTAWSLQQALSNPKVKPGDVIYLHEGIYRGHFSCALEGKSWGKNQFITVKSYPGEFATIDGNIYSANYRIPTGMDAETILMVSGKYVHFENFRITCLGDFTRIIGNKACNPKDDNFHGYTGIRHDPKYTAPCRFINLIIDNIPGVGFASWKETADTEIYGCLMYYNGYIKSLRKKCGETWDLHDADKVPSNVIAMENCIYTQNNGANKKTRRISNNLFLNNYKSGIAIWSANKKPLSDNLSNYDVDSNIFVNNGGPVRGETPNMLISSDSRNGLNHPQNIDVRNNVFYFNNSYDISGLSTVRNRNVSIRNNRFYHGTAAIELSGTNRQMTFSDNLYVGKRIKIAADLNEFTGNGIVKDKWKMSGNRYYTTNPNDLFLVKGLGGISLDEFRKRYNTETKSSTPAGALPVQKLILRNAYNPNRFHVTYYNSAAKPGSTDFDFSPYKIPNGTFYTIRDAEDYHNPIAKGRYVASGGKIAFPVIATPGFEMPRPSAASGKTAYATAPVHSKLNFRVYVIEFDPSQ